MGSANPASLAHWYSRKAGVRIPIETPAAGDDFRDSVSLGLPSRRSARGGRLTRQEEVRQMSLVENVVVVVAAALAAALLWRWFPRKVVVPQGHVAALYRDGLFLRLLQPGARWLSPFGLSHRLVDIRPQILTIAGQEVLTLDHVSLKVSVVCRFGVQDADAALHRVQDHLESLYLAVQLALRDLVACVSAEGLMTDRRALNGGLVERARLELEPLGIAVLSVEIKDLMLPADLKRTYADVLKAKKEGEAALQRARGESASLRNLVNAARLIERNPALLQLRFLGSVDTVGKGSGNTLVLGMPEGKSLASGVVR